MGSNVIQEHRDRAAQDAFLEPRKGKIGDFEIRPFSAGSMNLARKLELSMFEGADPTSLDPEERERQFYSFLFIQTKPLPEILRLSRSLPLLKDAIEAFKFEVPADLLPAIAEELNRVLTQAGAAVVEVRQKPGKPGGPTPPGNSSRQRGSRRS